MVTKKKQNEIKMFVASASDCEELRAATIKTVASINSDLSSIGKTLKLYVWEDCKRAGFVGSGNYQKKIFEEFGDHCDIFVIFFWTKLGVGTVEEYEFFKNTFRMRNPKLAFFGFHYNKAIPHEVLEKHTSYYKLQAFLKKNQGDWAPLGRVRRAIADVDKYSEELRAAVFEYLFALGVIKGG